MNVVECVQHLRHLLQSPADAIAKTKSQQLRRTRSPMTMQKALTRSSVAMKDAHEVTMDHLRAQVLQQEWAVDAVPGPPRSHQLQDQRYGARLNNSSQLPHWPVVPSTAARQSFISGVIDQEISEPPSAFRRAMLSLWPPSPVLVGLGGIPLAQRLYGRLFRRFKYWVLDVPPPALRLQGFRASSIPLLELKKGVGVVGLIHNLFNHAGLNLAA
ncbi:hypothetical protein EV714DRAFT_277430 [Schizophyllum commune]